MADEQTGHKRQCAVIQNDIAGYREGWLSPQAARAVEEHIQQCPECRAHLHRDEALVHALESLAPAQAPDTAWASVAARRGLSLNPVDRRRVPLLAWAAAAAILALAAVMVPQVFLYRPAAVQPPVRSAMHAPVVRVAETSAPFALAAHALASASSAGDDPNRAILLGYAALEDRRP